VKHSTSKSSQKAVSWIFRNPLGLSSLRIILLNVVVRKRKSEGEQILKYFKAQVESFATVCKFSLKTQLIESDRHGVGHTIKAYSREVAPTLLVVGDSRKSQLRTYLTECDCHCPLILVKSDLPVPSQEDMKLDSKYTNVAIGVHANPHSDNGFKFLLQTMNIPKTSQLVVVHVVVDKDDKPFGREFLASFKPFCQGKQYAIRSALVYARKEKTIPGGLTTFSRDRKVDLMCIAAKPQGGKKARAGGKVVTQCVEQIACDIMIYKDDRTHSVDKHAGFAPPPARLQTRNSSKWISVSDLSDSTRDIE